MIYQRNGNVIVCNMLKEFEDAKNNYDSAKNNYEISKKILKEAKDELKRVTVEFKEWLVKLDAELEEGKPTITTAIVEIMDKDI